MPDDAIPSSPADHSLRRVQTGDENPALRQRAPTTRHPVTADAPGPGIRRGSTDGAASIGRRRSSNFSEYSLNEARRQFQSSTDDILLPKPSASGLEPSRDSSAWHSAPLAFALFPALGGMLFKNGSSVITDIMLLGLAAIFLNWSVRLPWDWYHSAQQIRQKEEYNRDTVIVDDDNGSEHPLTFSTATLDEVPEEDDESQPPTESKPVRRLPAHEAATNELYTHEVLALISCFLFPILGAYLLHTIRSQLSRPSEGLVSDYNLTIFLLASELRPMAHFVKLIQSRTLHLQRVVNSNPYDVTDKDTEKLKTLMLRVDELEARGTAAATAGGPIDPALNSKQSAALTTEIRRGLQPDLDALNRAVRRYEKRATLQAFQTESRLRELETRLNDAISLAAAAANNGGRQRGLTALFSEWAALAIVLPMQAFSALASLPFKTIIALVNYGQASIVGRKNVSSVRRSTNGKNPARVADRTQGRFGRKG